MGLDLNRWKRNFRLSDGAVVHIGASLVQERQIYRENRMEPVLWVEALPEIVTQAELLLLDYPLQRIVAGIVSDKSGVAISLKCASNGGESSSIFDSGLQSFVHPELKFETVFTYESTTIDDLVASKLPAIPISLLVLDVQGAELLALKGATATLDVVDFIFSEVSTAKMYKKQPLFREISGFLGSAGFSLVEHNLYHRTFHGDALFIKTELAVKRNIEILNPPRSGSLYLFFLIFLRRLQFFLRSK
jgi:FkbM family methyltransferase